jgi:hypothetical protein
MGTVSEGKLPVQTVYATWNFPMYKKVRAWNVYGAGLTDLLVLGGVIPSSHLTIH